MTLETLFQLAAIAHLGLVAAGLTMPSATNLWEHIRTLPDFTRHLFKTYYVFIGFILVSFETLTFVYAGELTSGTPLAKAMCLIMTLFWLIRLAVAAWVFDVTPYLETPLLRLGYTLTNIVFGLLPFIYAIGLFIPAP